MRGHADAATLAAFREELLSARKAAQVSAHLAACSRCAALEAQLAEVTTLLNRATAPPMPDALTARIQAALAAEATARTAATAPHATPAPAAVPAMAGAGHDGMRGSGNGSRAGEDAGRWGGWRGHDRSWLALRVAAVTAAVAVIAGGGYGVSQLLTGENPAMNGGASGAGVGPGIKSPTPYMSAAGGIRSGPGSHTGASSGITEAPVVISSGTNYQPASLGAQASTVLNRMKHAAPSSPKPFRTLAPSQEGTSLFPHLRSCLAHVSSGQSPQLVDQSYYLGHPALIVVLPGANGGRPHALVVAPGCTAITAHILATAPLPHSA